MKKFPLSLSRFHQAQANAIPLNARHLEQELDLAQTPHIGDAAPPITLIRMGLGNQHIIQGLAIDQKHKLLYTTHVEGDPEQGVINRFHLQNSNLWSAQDAQKPSPLIGHQGISVDPHSDFLLSSAGSTVPNKGWYMLKFQYMTNAEPRNPQIIQLFDKRYSKITNSMPVITPDGQYLLVRGNINHMNVIRVFKYDLIARKNLSDISLLYEDEWNIDSGLTQHQAAFQGLTTDGNYVYLLSGGKNAHPKRLYVYDLSGNLIQKMDAVTLGQLDMLFNHRIDYWEPEGLTVELRLAFEVQHHVLGIIPDSGF
ncbi:phage baseplate protein [Acinetobacter bouvetii]|uniref:P68 RBP/TagC-like beta-propeller domain-containing protein n=1 Tax=Acinetobacter bouvetii TaxID=202951 RepID=A0A811GFA1_9GAMM|nr:hypothetical protein [Acinetobacter bouvetii]CAB1218760.1 hypothetical protein SFB21_2316 [Acinetobacter bouvetii]